MNKKGTCPFGQVPLLFISECSDYSSTAACAAANRCCVSANYRVSVKYWHLFLDSFFSFFVQNEFDFNNNKTKAAYLFHTFNKKKEIVAFHLCWFKFRYAYI